MTPDQVRACRSGLRLSQPKFGRVIGVGPLSINHYEHGRRHGSDKPYEIPKTTDMACGAAWLGVDGYTGLVALADKAASAARHMVEGGGGPPRLPHDAVPRWHVEAAVEELRSRGITLGDHFAFPLLPTLALWSSIDHWCREFGMIPPKLHPVVSATVPGVAIIEFVGPQDAPQFRTHCTGS